MQPIFCLLLMFPSYSSGTTVRSTTDASRPSIRTSRSCSERKAPLKGKKRRLLVYKGGYPEEQLLARADIPDSAEPEMVGSLEKLLEKVHDLAPGDMVIAWQPLASGLESKNTFTRHGEYRCWVSLYCHKRWQRGALRTLEGAVPAVVRERMGVLQMEQRMGARMPRHRAESTGVIHRWQRLGTEPRFAPSLSDLEAMLLRARERLSRSMIAVEAPGWQGATKAHTAGMKLRSNAASRDASAAKAIDLTFPGPLLRSRRELREEGTKALLHG